MYGDGGGVRAAVARVAGGGGGGKGAYYRAGVLGRGERSEAFWLLMCIIDRQVIVWAMARCRARITSLALGAVDADRQPSRSRSLPRSPLVLTPGRTVWAYQRESAP